MLRKYFLFLTLLSVAFFAQANPLQTLKIRDPNPGVIEDLLKAASLTPVGRMIRDILKGIKSAISNELESKPKLCIGQCCKC